MDELEARIAELAERGGAGRDPSRARRHAVMEHLGVEPGPVVGEALDFLLELRLDEGLLGEDEVTRRLDEWWANR